MDRDRTPAQHAGDAYEAIRAINHLTMGDALKYPADAYETVGGLHAAVSALPQAFRQIRARMNELETADRLRNVHSDDPDVLAALVGNMHAMLLAAEDSARTLEGQLSEAHSALSPLAYVEDPVDVPKEAPARVRPPVPEDDGEDMPEGLKDALRRMSERGPVINMGTGERVAEDGRLLDDED
ncbi:hypothetical protein ACIO3O_36860 [Streptomyces sp. NPDC087440]|uniref:hypothetical protein n=1 Tax=Streptomyces sp. NPDC087440 TaxID=3365790 RepID=UPI0038073145